VGEEGVGGLLINLWRGRFNPDASAEKDRAALLTSTATCDAEGFAQRTNAARNEKKMAGAFIKIPLANKQIKTLWPQINQTNKEEKIYLACNVSKNMCT